MTTSRLERFTVEKAQKAIGTVQNNRNKKQQRINTYAASMERGEWFDDGPPIFFSNGEMIDGQNRLHAVIKYGKPVTFRVTRGVDPRMKHVLDGQGPRNLGDSLKIEGYHDVTNLAAVCRLEWTYRENPDMFRHSGRTAKPSHFQLMDMLKETPGLEISLKRAMPWKKLMSGWCSPSIASFLHYQFSLRDRESANDFWQKMAYGIGMEEDSPVYKLRNWMIRAASRVGAAAITRRYTIAVLIKCWNAYIRGETPGRVIIWRTGGFRDEPYPTIQAPMADESL